jgi:hypothetical protein
MKTVEVSCAWEKCGYSPFPMEAGFYDRAQKNKETFYCPAGHANIFSGKPWREEKQTLKRRIELLKEERTFYKDQSLRAWRTCPWPECDFVASSGNSWDRRPLWNHMRAKHSMPALYQILAEAEQMEVD